MGISKGILSKFVTIMFLVTFTQVTWAAELLNLQKRVIAIDVGHAGNNQGAVSCTGIGEYFYNRNMAKMILAEIEHRGHFKAILIDDGNRKRSFSQRMQVAKSKKAALLISIHHDSVQPRYLSVRSHKGGNYRYCDKYQGYSIFYSEKNKHPSRSLRFAKLLGKELRGKGLYPTLHHAEKISGENREVIDKEKGIYRYDNLNILSQSDIPSVLLECGIIVNRTEEARLKDTSYQSKIVSSVILAIEHYFQAGQEG